MLLHPKNIVRLVGLVLLLGVGVFFFLSNTEEPMTIEIPEGSDVATFAAGCFRCTEAAFQELEGVVDVVVGYAGGTEVNPSYRDVASHKTSHREAIQIYYDPSRIGYDDLLEILWSTIDPLDDGGQFTDRGFQYTTAIFYHNVEQKNLADQSLVWLQKEHEEPIATSIIEYTTFYLAEDYHQDFYLHSAERYQQYKKGSGREDFFEKD